MSFLAHCITLPKKGISMRNILLTAVLAAVVASPLLCQPAYAIEDNNNQPDYNQNENFYVAGDLGMARFSTNYGDDNSVFGGVRFGWRWTDYVGPEIGFVSLGHPKSNVDGIGLSIKPQAITLGVNGKYNFYGNWFVTGRVGYMHSRTKIDTSYVDIYGYRQSFKDATNDDSWYAGVGVGYNLTDHLSVGAHYDNYRLKFGDPSEGDQTTTNVGTFSLSVEYRF